MTHHELVNECGIFFGMLQHVRTRSYHRHVSHQYIDELGYLVNVTFAQEITGTGFYADRLWWLAAYQPHHSLSWNETYST